MALGPQPQGPPKKQEQTDVIVDDADLIRKLGLGRSNKEREALITAIPHVEVHPLKTPYPPDEAWIAESKNAKEQWMAKWFDEDGKAINIADKRTSKKIKDREWTTAIDRAKLKVIQANESMIFVNLDLSAPDVLVVLRNFVPDPKIVKYIGDHALKVVLDRKNARVRCSFLRHPFLRH